MTGTPISHLCDIHKFPHCVSSQLSRQRWSSRLESQEHDKVLLHHDYNTPGDDTVETRGYFLHYVTSYEVTCDWTQVSEVKSQHSELWRGPTYGKIPVSSLEAVYTSATSTDSLEAIHTSRDSERHPPFPAAFLTYIAPVVTAERLEKPYQAFRVM